MGGLSLINAIAGAYSEDLAVICIVGAPNSNDYVRCKSSSLAWKSWKSCLSKLMHLVLQGTNRILHHTIGLPDFNQVHLPPNL